MKNELVVQYVEEAFSKLEAALQGRLMRDGINRNEGGFNSFPNMAKIHVDVEEARNILSVLLEEIETNEECK